MARIFNFGLETKADLYDGRHLLSVFAHPVPVFDEDGNELGSSALVDYDKGDKFSPRPYVAFWLRVAETEDILCRKFYVHETAESTAVNQKTHEVFKKHSPQEQARLEICTAAGGKNWDINEAMAALAKSTREKPFRAFILKEPRVDEDGEAVRDELGRPQYWHRIKLANPDLVAKAEAKAAEAAEAERQTYAAQAEAKRANKGRRGYAGNTGE